MNNIDLTKKLHDRNFTKYGFDMNLFVSMVSTILVLGFIIFTIAKPNESAEVFNGIKSYINTKYNWFFAFTINFALIFTLYLSFSKFGKIKLGGPKAKAEFSNFSWYSMLFSAGIGIGIFFFGVAEPIYHMQSIPMGLAGDNPVIDGFKIMYLHWGFNAWAVYGIVAIALGYFTYNKGLPLSLRSLFYPILKEKIFGIWGDIIDTLAVLSVLFGLATSLGLGAQQINSGLNYIFGIPMSYQVQIILIICITFIATLSVVSGISKGIRFLSEANFYITGVFLFGILILGPTYFIFSTYFNSVGAYILDFVKISIFLGVTEADIAWQGAWTIFYWAWWIAWTPFVGIFIARISKGRTIKEIGIGTIFCSSLAIFFAMTILGATSVFVNDINDGVMVNAVNSNVATALFAMIANLISSKVFQGIISFVGMVATILFFITSSDSGSLVVDNLTSGGKLDSPKVQRIFWAVMEGLIAGSVLVLGGTKALSTLQGVVIITGLPFGILVLIMCYSLFISLKDDIKQYEKYELNKLKKNRINRCKIELKR
ncbi:MAG: BCCT family transporter [Anaeromicrobium sp.]|jgi:choline/carnitine/betaine transport|uniref:BCCT family transporter n=1 Tax=Anaeromicrobium sp. TaxID=1929132 RepID=UPI0025F0880C|nr:BCCT family transporter [Anaeromicrobium sp.]MCT4593131.1 BCCT family transporter [Anaeromicrobium sp.]